MEQSKNTSVEVRLVEGLLNLIPKKQREELARSEDSVVTKAEGYLKIHGRLWIGHLNWKKHKDSRHLKPAIDVYPYMGGKFWQKLKPLQWAVDGTIEFVRNSHANAPNVVFCCNGEFTFRENYHRTMVRVSETHSLSGGVLIHGEEMSREGADICGLPWSDILIVAEYIRQWNKDIFEAADRLVEEGRIGPGMIDQAFDETARKMNPQLGQVIRLCAAMSGKYNVPVIRHEELPEEQVKNYDDNKPSSIIL